MKKSIITLLAVVPFALFAMGCEKDAKEEAGEAVKELKQGDGKQAAEEANEAIEKGVKDTADKMRDATR